MKDILFKVLKFLGVTDQIKKDLVALFSLAIVFFVETEDKMGAGNGAAKKTAAIDAFFSSVEEKGGIELPAAFTKPIARKLFGMLLDLVADLVKGEQPKN
jgi:hypothetical protein